MFDFMSIRKQISYNVSLDKSMAFIHLGGIVDIDPERLAAESLVFMIVLLKSNFKCPIAYFFIIIRYQSIFRHKL